MKVTFIRHAESTSNIGDKSSSEDKVQLTYRGVEQAKHIPFLVQGYPDQIIQSNYLRARHTANYTIHEYPNASVEIGPVHEFYYLDFDKPTNREDRKPYREDYWNFNSRDFRFNHNTESFNMFMERVKNFLIYVNQKKCENILVFTHGLFINAVIMQVSMNHLLHSDNQMEVFNKMPVLNNGSSITLTF